MKMDKFCVFCGKKPQEKNKEHILPKWLIELTGDPGREIYIGRKWTDSELNKRQFLISSFTFPSCKKCNDEFSNLERKAKEIVLKLLDKKPLCVFDIDILLDWLDKVRIGLWLAMIYLNDNYRGLDPMFHIEQRIGAHDRFVIIYSIEDDGTKGVNMGAVDTPVFHCMPSCFTLMINNILLFNVSSQFLFAEEIGFPYPKEMTHAEKGGIYCDMVAGTEKIQFPLISKNFKTGGTQLFQPAIPINSKLITEKTYRELEGLYDAQYVHNNSLIYEKGKGDIFRRNRNDLVKFSREESIEWFPKVQYPRGLLLYETGLLAGELLEDFFQSTLVLSMDKKSEADQKNIKEQISGVLKLHKIMYEHHKKQKTLYCESDK